MREPARRSLHPFVAAVAAYGLPTRSSAIRKPLDDIAWIDVLRVFRRERLAALLDRSIAEGAVPATDRQREEAENEAAQGARGVLRVEEILLDVGRALEAERVEFRVLKGAAVARLDEADPSLRQYADVDLLVRGSEIGRAVSILGSLGFHRDLPERRVGYDHRFGKEVSLRSTMGLEIDLHRTLVLGYFGLTLPLVELWRRSTTFELAGTSLAALDHESRFVHACHTAMLGDPRPRLLALRDLAVIAHAHTLDEDRVRELAPTGRGAAVVQAAVRTAVDVLDLAMHDTLPLPAVSGTPVTERLALRAYRAQGGSNTLELLSGALAVRGRDRITYLGSLVRPSPEYRSARRRAGRPREWSTALEELAAAAAGRARRGDHDG